MECIHILLKNYKIAEEFMKENKKYLYERFVLWQNKNHNMYFLANQVKEIDKLDEKLLKFIKRKNILLEVSLSEENEDNIFNLLIDIPSGLAKELIKYKI